MNNKNLKPLMKKQEERRKIKKWFSDNDWIVNKVVLGEWTNDDERFLLYIATRNEKRTKLDLIEEEIKAIRLDLGFEKEEGKS